MEYQSETERLPIQIEAETWGEIREVSQECPGVYYLATEEEGRFIYREFYAVTKEAVPDVISPETLAYRTQTGQIHPFEHEAEGSGWPEYVSEELLLLPE